MLTWGYTNCKSCHDVNRIYLYGNGEWFGRSYNWVQGLPFIWPPVWKLRRNHPGTGEASLSFSDTSNGAQNPPPKKYIFYCFLNVSKYSRKEHGQLWLSFPTRKCITIGEYTAGCFSGTEAPSLFTEKAQRQRPNRVQVKRGASLSHAIASSNRKKVLCTSFVAF